MEPPMSEPENTPPTDEPRKRCSKCGEEKPATTDHYHRQSDGKYGLRAVCRVCRDQSKTGTESWKRYTPPPIEALPEGFEVAKIATEVDASGAPLKQHIGARPERTANAPIITAPSEGYQLKRLSTLTDSNGKVIQQWQILTPEDEAREKREKWLLDAIAGLAEKWPAREPIALEDGPPTEDRLMCAIPMGDPHFGQYSWAAETGDDYDLQLAESYHVTAMKALVSSAPRAKRGLLINLGDFVHADNSSNQTLRGHHQLDVDTRWPKVIRSSVHAVIKLVQLMLAKFEEVEVWMVPGNHDPHSCVMLAIGLALFFKDEPRVKVNDEASLFFYTRFGVNLIGATHTHTIKDRATLGEIMPMHRPIDWGYTNPNSRFFYCGHVHHDSLLETRSGVIVETMRTLAGKDKFAAESGYGSGRDMKCDVFDIEDGRVQRNTIGIRQIVRRLKERNTEEKRNAT
jgi:hypothetical protein